MGFASFLEVWVEPMVRDWKIFVPMVGFYFGCQYACTRLLPKLIGSKKIYDSLKKEEKEDMIIRGCSIINGLVMTGSAVLFVRNMLQHHFVFPEGFYDPLPNYRFYRVAIVAYFAWDTITCFAYNWSTAFKIHGICSLIGTYTLSFPYSENFSGYYTGCFELSNAPLHVSIVLRMLERLSGEALEDLVHSKGPGSDEKEVEDLRRRKERYGQNAALAEYTFAGMFLLIRVVGGTYVTGTWLRRTLPLLYQDLTHLNDTHYRPNLHSESAVVAAVLAIVVIQGLQYVWFGEIVKRGLALLGNDSEKEKKE